MFIVLGLHWDFSEEKKRTLYPVPHPPCWGYRISRGVGTKIYPQISRGLFENISRYQGGGLLKNIHGYPGGVRNLWISKGIDDSKTIFSGKAYFHFFSCFSGWPISHFVWHRWLVTSRLWSRVWNSGSWSGILYACGRHSTYGNQYFVLYLTWMYWNLPIRWILLFLFSISFLCYWFIVMSSTVFSIAIMMMV